MSEDAKRQPIDEARVRDLCDYYLDPRIIQPDAAGTFLARACLQLLEERAGNLQMVRGSIALRRKVENQNEALHAVLEAARTLRKHYGGEARDEDLESLEDAITAADAVLGGKP